MLLRLNRQENFRSQNCCCECHNNECERQEHVHEFLGSTKIAEREEDPHNHRFAGVTGEAIHLPNCTHYHIIKTKTDFFDEHFHTEEVKTGPGIMVDRDHHVHFVEGCTSCNDGHKHEFEFATLIDNPIGRC